MEELTCTRMNSNDALEIAEIDIGKLHENLKSHLLPPTDELFSPQPQTLKISINLFFIIEGKIWIYVGRSFNPDISLVCNLKLLLLSAVSNNPTSGQVSKM